MKVGIIMDWPTLPYGVSPRVSRGLCDANYRQASPRFPGVGRSHAGLVTLSVCATAIMLALAEWPLLIAMNCGSEIFLSKARISELGCSSQNAISHRVWSPGEKSLRFHCLHISCFPPPDILIQVPIPVNIKGEMCPKRCVPCRCGRWA